MLSAYFSNNNINSNCICGKVLSYQSISADGFTAYNLLGKPIDSQYLDSVSFTMGSSRKHVWSYAAGVIQSSQFSGNCPCARYPGTSPPIYVQNQCYFESSSALLYFFTALHCFVPRHAFSPNTILEPVLFCVLFLLHYC